MKIPEYFCVNCGCTSNVLNEEPVPKCANCGAEVMIVKGDK